MTKPTATRTFAACFLILATLLTTSVSASQAELVTWQQVPSPNRGTRQNTLKGISAVSSTDLWAVGEWNPGVPPTETGRRTLAMHWNGSSWRMIRSPNPSWTGLDFATLEDVVALAANDVWAVGYSEDFASLRSNTLILHWDGTAWSRVPSPNPAGQTLPNRLYGVSAVSASDIWAVGEMGTDYRPLILRWNGTRWRSVANACEAGLRGVSALAANDVWAVGDATTCHSDGQSWQTVPSPQPRPQYNEISYPLQDVSGSSASDVWAVGARVIDNGQYLTWVTLVEHWNGSTWTLADSAPGQVMYGVEAVSANDVWAVGTTGTTALILHWSGSWSQVPAPSPGAGSRLFDIDAVGASNLWAVGSYFGGSGDDKTLVVRGAEP